MSRSPWGSTVRGSFFEATSTRPPAAARKFIDEALDDAGHGRATVLIDLTDLTYCDRSGIRVLLDAAHRCYKNDADFRVVGARRDLRRVFEITHTIEILNVDDSTDVPR